MRDTARFPDVQAVTAQMQIPGQLIANGQNVSSLIMGVDEYMPSVRGLKVGYGAFLSADDMRDRTANAVLGAQVAKTLFGSPQAALGQSVRANVAGAPLTLTVVGVMAERGSSAGSNDDDQVYLPLSTVQAKLPFARDPKSRRNIQQLTVKVRNADELASTQDALRQLMLERHNGREDFSVKSQNDLLATANQVTQTLTILLGAIAGISLVVGGIGIMNIMLVSVAERTREIGILKAVGARRGDILRQFVMESLTVTFCRRRAGRRGRHGRCICRRRPDVRRQRPCPHGRHAFEHRRGVRRLGAGRAVLRHLPGVYGVAPRPDRGVAVGMRLCAPVSATGAASEGHEGLPPFNTGGFNTLRIHRKRLVGNEPLHSGGWTVKRLLGPVIACCLGALLVACGGGGDDKDNLGVTISAVPTRSLEALGDFATLTPVPTLAVPTAVPTTAPPAPTNTPAPPAPARPARHRRRPRPPRRNRRLRRAPRPR